MPMRVPERIRASLQGPLIRQLRRASGHLTLSFRPGTHLLPIGEGPPCEIELQPGARAFLRFEVGPGDGQDGPVLHSADLHFTPPLAIHNVAQTLGQVHLLAEDRLLSFLRPIRPRLPGWVQELGGLALGSADVAATVLLEHVQIRVKPATVPLLRPAFSGRVRWFDQLELPFERLRLPGSVLPIPFAELERLLSGRPLATAEVLHPFHDPLGLLAALRASLESAEGEITAALDPPPLRLLTQSIDGVQLSATVRARRGASPGVRAERADQTLRPATSPLGGGQSPEAALCLRATLQAQLEPESGVMRLGVPELRLHCMRGGEPLPECGPGARAEHCAQGDDEIRLRVAAAVEADLEPSKRPWSDRIRVQMDADLLDGSRWPSLLVDLHSQQSLCKGESTVPVCLEQIALQGGASIRCAEGRLHLTPTRPLELSCSLTSVDPVFMGRAGLDLSGMLDKARLEAAIRPHPAGHWEATARLETGLSARLQARLTPIAELNLHHGTLEGEILGRVGLDLRAELDLDPEVAGFGLDLAGTQMQLILDRFTLALDGRRLTLPAQTGLTGRLIYGTLSAVGPGPFALDLQWDLHGAPCLLHHGDLAVSLLSPELRRGALVLHLDRRGKLSFSGQKEGFYGVRYFNALLNPATDPGYLQELLRSDDAVGHVVRALEALNPELAELLTDLQALWRAAETILAREEIRRPGDFIPRLAMTRVFSRLLTGDDRLQQRLIPIVKGATEGGGLDLAATRELLQHELGEFDIDYEVSFLLNWLDLVLSPAEVLDPPRIERDVPIDLNPAFAEASAGLPTASEIYQAVGQGQIDRSWACRLADLAPRLTRGQLGYVLERATFDAWPTEALARIRYVYDLKRRVEEIAQGYGGVEYALQPLYIAAFLGEAVGPLPGINTPEEAAQSGAQDGVDRWPPVCALGPEEVAHLLQAGLAWGRQDAQTQLNNRLLLELLRREPPAFTREVSIELGEQSPRALSGVLYAFLAQDQDQIAEPIDLAQLLEEKLDLPVPRQTDYMAGGRKARESYYEALSRLADTIIGESGSYLAAKLRLQAVRHPAAPELVIEAPVERLERRARQSVARADELAARCCFDGGGRGGPRQRSREAYRRAFRACAALRERERRAFQLPWFKDFWLRNEEALRVLSVVRGHQEDRDDDRRWLAVQTGRSGPTDEQNLLETVVGVLYWQPDHRRALLADPLVRLLIDPEPGRHDFTVISCMGVITEGKDGAELEHAYRRLEERRGVRVIRAHTGTARTLEYNARRIIEAIEDCRTPYGLIGYSQGCANVLMAESMLYTGTPDERGLLGGLVTRNLLFSSANGSAHGTCGMLKFRRAMVLGERYLKHYQAVMSREAVEAVLSVLKGVLDSRVFIAVLGGAHSLTYERARVLHRDGQFLDHVPTCYTRAVSGAQIIPETLEYLYYMLREQTGRDDQDTQVLITDAVGHATRIENEYTNVLRRCDMGALPQATHHWAPLTREVEPITTSRDIERAVYMSPKDRLVWPWIEVNARFGLIRPR